MAQPVFHLPLEDNGDGSVGLNATRGTGPATYARATIATCRQWKPYYLPTGERVTLDLDFVSSQQLTPRVGSQTVICTRSGTATRVNPQGFIESVAINTPRFDFDPITKAARGLLVEDSRTNLILRSDDFSVTWGVENGVVSANQGLAPDGTLSADHLIPNDLAGNCVLNQGITSVSGTTYTSSVYFNTASTLESFQFYMTWNGGSFGSDRSVLVVTVATQGVVASNTGVAPIPTFTVTNAGNGWYRVTLTATANASGASTYTLRGNGVSDGVKFMRFWGAQCEVGSLATSYIPTQGITLARGSETVSIASLTGWFNSVEGTLFTEYLAPTDSVQREASPASFHDGTVNERIVHRHLPQVNEADFLIWDGNVLQCDTGFAGLAKSSVVRSAAAWRLNEVAHSVNGVAVQTDSNVTIPTVTTLDIGGTGVGRSMNGHVRRLVYVPIRLSNAFLQTLSAASPTLINGSNLIQVGSGVARAHYWSDGSYGGYFAEGARTNLCLQSEDLSTTWANTASGEVVNVAVAPHGLVVADKLTEDATTAVHFISQSISFTTGQASTISAFMKAAERTRGGLFLSSAAFPDAARHAWFDLAAGTVGGVEGNAIATIESWGNGWYRCTLTQTADATVAGTVGLYLTQGGFGDSFAGTNGSGFFVWGTQIEVGAFASSYIPTTTVSVTRNEDSMRYPISNISTSAGTVYAESRIGFSGSTGFAIIVASGATAGDHWQIYRRNGSDQTTAHINDSTNVLGKTGLLDWSTGIRRRASSWGSLGQRITGDGLAPATSAFDGSMPVDGGSVGIGNPGNAGTGNSPFGTIKNVMIWNVQLSDTGLQNISAGGYGDVGDDHRVTVAASAPYALLFDGIDDVVTVTHAAPINLGSGDVSFEFEFTTPSSFSGTRGIIWKGPNGPFNTNGTGYEIRQNVNNLEFGRGNGAGTTARALFAPAVSTKYHVIARYKDSDGTLQFVVDGKPQTALITTTTGAFTDTANLRLGQGNDGFWNGRIGKVLVYTTFLTDVQCIEQFLHALKNNTGLVGRWDLDEGTGVAAKDLSGNNNNGVITGATWQT